MANENYGKPFRLTKEMIDKDNEEFERKLAGGIDWSRVTSAALEKAMETAFTGGHVIMRNL